MTETALRSGHKLRSVDVALRQEADSWAMADAVYEDYEELSGNRFPDSNREIGEIYDAITDALVSVGLDYKQATVRRYRQTRRAWPPEERVPQASFTAHYLLRAETYDKKRKQTLERLSRKSKSGNVTAHAVRVWISERKPRKNWTFLQLAERRLRASAKSVGSPWHTLADDDRGSIAAILRKIAAEIESGEFPK